MLGQMAESVRARARSETRIDGVQVVREAGDSGGKCGVSINLSKIASPIGDADEEPLKDRDP